MTRNGIGFLILAILAGVTAGAAQIPHAQAYHPHRIMLKFTAGSNLFTEARLATIAADGVVQTSAASPQNLSRFSSAHKITKLQAAKPDASLAPLPGGMERIFFAEVDPSVDLMQSIAALQQTGEFEYVEPDYVGYGEGSPVTAPGVPVASPSLAPNDPYFGYEWGFQNTGQTINSVVGKAGADINIVPAWGITTGNPRTLLTVLDTGIPLTAAEFAGRLIQGYDFVNNDASPADDQGHGSNTMSVAGATGNNGAVMAGVNWRCRLQSIKVLDASNSGYYTWWISGLRLAADSGAKVISMSMGGSSASSTLADAVTYASGKGAIVVACMMNNNNEIPYYPAAYTNVIAVGALNNLDRRAVPFCWGGGSSYGAHIDFVAPGEMIYGLYYLDPTQVSAWCGTSQATPMVSGIISLMLGLDSSLTFQQVYDKLKASAHDRIGDATEDVAGWDKYYGWGRVDAYGALQLVTTDVQEPAPATPQGYALEQNYPNPFNPSTKIVYTVAASGSGVSGLGAGAAGGATNSDLRYQNSEIRIPGSSWVRLSIYDVLGREVAVLVNEPKASGSYTATWNAAGVASGIYFYRLTGGGFTDVKKMAVLR